MAKKKSLSHDQKRKAKLARRAARLQPQEPLAYKGSRYKTDELSPVYYQTELGIYEAFVMTDRQLTDRAVEAALEKLVQDMRQGPLPPLQLDEHGEGRVEGGEDDLVIWNIRKNWKDFFAGHPHPGKDKLIGVLRTLLGSIQNWSTPAPQSRGYLHFVEGFLTKAGASVQKVSADTLEPLPAPAEDELLRLGRSWCRTGATDPEARFREAAEDLIHSGQAERVAEVCQQLMGENADDLPLAKKLGALSLHAQGGTRLLPE